MFMARITKTEGVGSAQFVAPVRARAVARWTPDEQRIIDQAIRDGLDLDQTHRLIPYRSRDSVKDRYYRSREPQDRDAPAAITDARRQKDAEQGSARLLEAIERALGICAVRKAS
jgi:hypothetical protein